MITVKTDFQKGLFIGLGVATALVVIGFVTRAIKV